MLLPSRVTPHTLRRTFASLCFFAGRDLRWVMGQLGHEDPRMTLADTFSAFDEDLRTELTSKSMRRLSAGVS
jgi:integrase